MPATFLLAELDAVAYVHDGLRDEVAMDRIDGVGGSSSDPSFTDKQGQYLAFIDAYTRVNGRPPAETDMQRHFRVSPPPCTRWCSHSSGPA
jgi:hypothetical protein